MCDEYAKCWTESEPVARKDHKCCECGETVPAGVQYYRFSGVWSSGADTHKQCMRCRKYWKLLDKVTDCISFTMLWEEMWEWFIDQDKFHLPEWFVVAELPEWIREKVTEWLDEEAA